MVVGQAVRPRVGHPEVGQVDLRPSPRVQPARRLGQVLAPVHVAVHEEAAPRVRAAAPEEIEVCGLVRVDGERRRHRERGRGDGGRPPPSAGRRPGREQHSGECGPGQVHEENVAVADVEAGENVEQEQAEERPEREQGPLDLEAALPSDTPKGRGQGQRAEHEVDHGRLEQDRHEVVAVPALPPHLALQEHRAALSRLRLVESGERRLRHEAALGQPGGDPSGRRAGGPGQLHELDRLLDGDLRRRQAETEACGRPLPGPAGQDDRENEGRGLRGAEAGSASLAGRGPAHAPSESGQPEGQELEAGEDRDRQLHQRQDGTARPGGRRRARQRETPTGARRGA